MLEVFFKIFFIMKSKVFVLQMSNLFKRSSFVNYLNNNVILKCHTISEEKTNDHSIKNQLANIIDLKRTNNSSWIIETKVNFLCEKYNAFNKNEKSEFLSLLASEYGVNHDKIHKLAKRIASIQPNNCKQLISEEKALKDALKAPYHWLFERIGRLENGIKFLVDLRANNLDLIGQFSENSKDTLDLGQMDATLKELLYLWFSVGFMKVERVTWQTPSDIMQKVSDYEAIHPMKNWTELKRRVGPYRRCFIFTHPSMPREPLVLLHTALSDDIPETVKGIQEAENRIIGRVIGNQEKVDEDKSKIKAAIFYSIASTQVGLQGIELGNYLIKEVAKQISNEFPKIDKFSTLSPVPNFKTWLLDKIKRNLNAIFTKSEQEEIKNELNLTVESLSEELKKIFNNSFWAKDTKLTTILKKPMLRSCAWYIYREKRRNYALNNVANFHLRNGAVVWRINWMADTSPRGMSHSFGIMINYRYFLEKTEFNSTNYIEKYHIEATSEIINLAKEAEKLNLNLSSDNVENV